MLCKVTKIASIYNRSSLNLGFLKHLFSPNAFIALPLDLKTNRESATNVNDHYTFSIIEVTLDFFAMGGH